MKLYFVESASADNFVLAETSRGVLASNCAPDGCFAGVSLHGEDPAAIVAAIRSVIVPDICEEDLDWMGDVCCESVDAFVAEQADWELWQQDRLHLIGEY